MHIAVVYNRQRGNVINLFGLPNRERIGLKTIRRLVTALRKGGHRVVALEGDKDLIERLEEFMPRVVKGERPGLVLNVSYGIQGQARYTHVPSILEMVGIPYVASGPLAHSLCLDKVVTKMILRQHGLPTPDFAVLHTPDSPVVGLTFPLIVKPKSEAVSFGLKVVETESELRNAARVIYDEYRQAVLAEQFIEGREVNVGLLGNGPPGVFPPVELVFGDDGPAIYTYEDKTGRSGRTVSAVCPAPIGEELQHRAQDLARQAFMALGCCDCARVDMRLDADGRLYVLEVNSLPSLGEHGSYLVGAEHVGLDFTKFVNRLVDVASARYFGTPAPPSLLTTSDDPMERVFAFVTEHRDPMERRLKELVNLSSRTNDPIGIRQAMSVAAEGLEELGLTRVDGLSDSESVATWQTPKGMADGILLIANLDVPIDVEFPPPPFRRDPEWLYGDGVGSARAPVVMMEYALRALKRLRRLRHLPLGVVLYADEGQDARYSADEVRAAGARARTVLVLRPGLGGGKLVTQRRGQRIYRLRVDGRSRQLGRSPRRADPLPWISDKLNEISRLTSRAQRLSVSPIDLRPERVARHLPHRVTATIVVTYPVVAVADTLEDEMRAILGKGGVRWKLDEKTDRPPLVETPENRALAGSLRRLAARWDIRVSRGSSGWPSVAGLVPPETTCVCGLGPIAHDLQTPHERVERISLVQRTLLLAGFLATVSLEA